MPSEQACNGCLHDPDSPIYTSPRFLPPAKVQNCKVVQSIVSHGVFMEDAVIENAIIGLRSRIGAGADIRDTMVIGADFYESEEDIGLLLADGKVPVGIGAGTTIRNCIVDKNARIGQNCVIVNQEGIEEANREDEGFYIRSGIVTVLRNAVIPDGTTL